MTVLVIGKDGRGAALVSVLRKSVFVKDIIWVPNELGVSECVWCSSDMVTGMSRLISYAGRKDIDFVVIGPEAPLVAGVADIFRSNGKAIFGPSKRAAQLEGSKVSAKLFCRAYGIPTPDFDIAETPEQAKRYVHKRGVPVVVKADGLAGGKGVTVAHSTEEAHAAIDILSKLPAGRRLVIEECLIGWECSYIVFTDGIHFVSLPPVSDYKETQKGSHVNTGGMGCSTLSSKKFTPALERQIEKTILVPTLTALQNEGRPFTGALFIGLMIEGGRPYVLEFNCRFGDPETQTVLPLLEENRDLFPWLHATTNGTMSFRVSPWKKWHSVCIVLAANGYPGMARMGDVITGIEEARKLEHVSVFESGTRHLPNGDIVTAGGRVVSVVAVASEIPQARACAYEAVEKINFKDMWYRKDIGE